MHIHELHEKKIGSPKRNEIDSYLDHLRERAHNLGILVAVQLDGVDERHLRLWSATERFENFNKSLRAGRRETQYWRSSGSAGEKNAQTVSSLMNRPSC